MGWVEAFLDGSFTGQSVGIRRHPSSFGHLHVQHGRRCGEESVRNHGTYQGEERWSRHIFAAIECLEKRRSKTQRCQRSTIVKPENEPSSHTPHWRKQFERWDGRGR